MLVNDVHVQGMFLYDSEATYEKGDFIVVDDTIFVCNPNDGSSTVTGINPKTDETGRNFKIYLGDRITDLNEYTQFAENQNSNSGSKYIDLKSLPGILNQYLVGFDGRGVIRQYIGEEEYVIYNPKTGKMETEIYGEGERKWSSSTILDEIFKDPKLNNAIFFISKKFKGIASLLPQTQNDSQIRSEMGRVGDNMARVDYATLNDCILRQYTYINGTGFGDNYERTDSKFRSYYHRLQELIDPSTGMIFYRVSPQVSINGKDSLENIFSELDNNWTKGVEWKSVLPGGTNGIENGKSTTKLLEQWTHVINYYQQEVNNYQELQSYLANRFGFKAVRVKDEADTERNKLTLTNFDPKDQVGYVKDDATTLTGVTVRAIYKMTDMNLYRSCEITVDMTSNIKEYMINDHIMLKISGVTLEVAKYDKGVDEASIVISDVYYREHYMPKSTEATNPYPSAVDLASEQIDE